MNDKKIYFTQIVFYLEDSIKEIFIDYIEEDSEFTSIDFSKVERNYWFCKLILKSRNIKPVSYTHLTLPTKASV